MRVVILTAISMAHAAAANAQWLVAPGTEGTLAVEYEFTSAGKTSDGNDDREWQVSRKLNVTARLVADRVSPVSGARPMEASTQQALNNRQARAASGQQKMAPLMADVEKLLAKCGEDEACMERESMRLLGGMDRQTVRSAGADAAAAARPMDSRYQPWKLVVVSGNYAVDETHAARLADPLCRGQPNMQCVTRETRSGGGPLSAIAPGPLHGVISALEVDGMGKDMHLTLPMPVPPLRIKRTVTTTSPEVKAGTFTGAMVPFSKSVKPIVVPLPGGLRGASGTQRIPVQGGGADSGTLTIRWRFTSP